MKKKNDETNMCGVERPSWEIAKTKQMAYTYGYNKGFNSATEVERAIYKEELEKMKIALQQERAKNLSHICQAGATIIDAIAHAYRGEK